MADGQVRMPPFGVFDQQGDDFQSCQFVHKHQVKYAVARVGKRHGAKTAAVILAVGSHGNGSGNFFFRPVIDAHGKLQRFVFNKGDHPPCGIRGHAAQHALEFIGIVAGAGIKPNRTDVQAGAAVHIHQVHPAAPVSKGDGKSVPPIGGDPEQAAVVIACAGGNQAHSGIGVFQHAGNLPGRAVTSNGDQ